MKAKEFTLEGHPEFEFRTKYVSPIDILALSTTSVSFEELKQTKEFYCFALENVEVKVGEKWFPVKYQGRDVYTPPELEDDIVMLNDIIQWYLENVIVAAFQKSSE